MKLGEGLECMYTCLLVGVQAYNFPTGVFIHVAELEFQVMSCCLPKKYQPQVRVKPSPAADCGGGEFRV